MKITTKIDRNNYQDAKKVFEKLLPDNLTRRKVIDFLVDAIEFADFLNNQEWNLNLDKDGQFIRFNTGHEYCIEIREKSILILCDRLTLKPALDINKIPIKFRGHIGDKKVESDEIENVPDCVAKTKNSIGCVLDLSNENNNIETFRKSNHDFINFAIKTHQLPQMRNAHSKGVIEYLSRETERKIPNPIYATSNLPTLNQIVEDKKWELKSALKLSAQKRKEILAKSNPKPTRITVSLTIFNRNQYVVAEVLSRANGICEKCKMSAPFKKDICNEPYLEVHHIIPLSEGGDDTVENAIGLCPNCHKHAHYGKLTYE